MKFEENKTLKKAKEKLFELLSEKARGDLVKHAEIEKLTGITRGQSQYYAMVRRVGAMIEDANGFSIIPETNIGYLVATKQQQFGLYATRKRRARKQIAKGVKSVGSLPLEELTPHESKLKNALLEMAAEEKRKLAESDSLHAYLMRRKPGEPLKIHLRDEEENQETA